MAAGPTILYHNARLAILDGSIDLLNHSLRVALLKPSYTPDLAHMVWADVSAHECDASDYGQQTLETKDLSLNSNVARLDAADISFGNPVTMAAKYAVIYDDSSPTDLLISYVDLETTNSNGVSSTSSEFRIQWNGQGLFGWGP